MSVNENSGKKDLTLPDDRQDNIWRKLKLLASEKGHGRLRCEIVIRDGRICEVRHREFEGVIR